MLPSSFKGKVQRFAEEEARKLSLIGSEERLSVSLRIKKLRKSDSRCRSGGYHWIRTGEEITESDWATILSLNFKRKTRLIQYLYRAHNKPIERDTAAFMIGRKFWTNNMDEINRVFREAGVMIRLLKVELHANSYHELYDCVCLFKVRKP